MNSLLIVIALAGSAVGNELFGGGNRDSVENLGDSCIVVPAATTNCTGVTGHNCSDSTYLAVSSP